VNVLHFGEITGLTGVEGKLSSLVVFTVADSRFLPEIAKIQKPGKRVVCLGASPGWPELSYTHKLTAICLLLKDIRETSTAANDYSSQIK